MIPEEKIKEFNDKLAPGVEFESGYIYVLEKMPPDIMEGNTAPMPPILGKNTLKEK